MKPTDRDKWDDRYREREVASARAAEVLCDHLHLVPRSGSALDLACGLGANALLLAARGLAVEAWDRSPVAVEKLAAAARRGGLDLHEEGRIGDLDAGLRNVAQLIARRP
ncbi:hypothetical protein [Endothiovibrio diazotrophicus]